MTTIVIEKSHEGTYKGFTCMGHAGYARKGKPDILCSAVSALSIHTINGLEKVAGQDISVSTDESTGFMRCVIKGTPLAATVTLMDAFVNSVEDLSDEYGEKFLQVKIQEVNDNA
ncbi:MAG: ribosomal-processing cysteine protease Prp [Lachnospiraceae bacterium]|nr:ribosomal-processing cysteine protease Prp [Lachnospiraceae bacterium]